MSDGKSLRDSLLCFLKISSLSPQSWNEKPYRIRERTRRAEKEHYSRSRQTAEVTKTIQFEEAFIAEQIN